MRITSVLLAVMLSVSTGAFAHLDHDDEPQQTIKLDATKSTNGVTVHVNNQGAKVSTAGATGKLLWVKGTAKGEANLLPAGINGMEAKGARPPVGSKARATITFADKRAFTGDVALK